MMHISQYVTNSTNLKKMLVAKFFSSSTMKIRKFLGHKTLDVVASSKRIINRELFACVLYV